VTDPSGAPVPNVAITITHTETGVTRHISTNDVGQYVAPDVHIGHVTVHAEASGFKVAEQKDIVIQVGERARVDFKLEIGSTQESVNVEATAISVQTDSGEVSDVITGQQVAQLATNGRSLYSLAFLTAGATANMPDFQSPTPDARKAHPGQGGHW
jgi:Carboxypeptidase regulatory-like domain